MKTNLSRKSFWLIGSLMIILSFQPLLAQEMLTGGNMESDDASAWTVATVQRGDDAIPNNEFSYEFGYTTGTCTSCNGGALYLSSDGSVYANITFSQEVTLKANTKYIADAAFRDLTGTLQNFWAQLKICYDGSASTLETGDDVKLIGFNTWAGCGQYVNGTFRADGCDADEADTISKAKYNGVFTTPDTLGESFTAIFTIMVGMWTNTASGAFPYEILIDQVSLIDSVAAIPSAIHTTSQTPDLVVYPVPATDQATVSYTLTGKSDVKLSLYNVLGQEVKSLYSGVQEAGSYETTFDVSDISNSILFCKLEIGDKVITRKVVISK